MATMPTRYAPLPVLIDSTGATAGGHALACTPAGTLLPFSRESDPDDAYERILARAARARNDGFLLCLRATADRPACVDLGAHAFADASLQADFESRAIVIDPYDADGGDIRDRAPVAGAA